MDKIILERRSSLVPELAPTTPHILISDYEEQNLFYSAARRASAAGIWPLGMPVGPRPRRASAAGIWPLGLPVGPRPRWASDGLSVPYQ